MDHHEKRLSDYLEKIQGQFKWDREHQHQPLSFFNQHDDRPRRPNTDIDEQRAKTMGKLPEFHHAAVKKRGELLEAEVDRVRTVSSRAASAYDSELSYWRGMDEYHIAEQAQSQRQRVFRRWREKDVERQQERLATVRDQVAAKDFPQVYASGRSMKQLNGGFNEHAKRETALEKARQYTAQRETTLLLPDRGQA